MAASIGNKLVLVPFYFFSFGLIAIAFVAPFPKRLSVSQGYLRAAAAACDQLRIACGEESLIKQNSGARLGRNG